MDSRHLFLKLERKIRKSSFPSWIQNASFSRQSHPRRWASTRRQNGSVICVVTIWQKCGHKYRRDTRSWCCHAVCNIKSSAKTINSSRPVVPAHTHTRTHAHTRTRTHTHTHTHTHTQRTYQYFTLRYCPCITFHRWGNSSVVTRLVMGPIGPTCPTVDA